MVGGQLISIFSVLSLRTPQLLYHVPLDTRREKILFVNPVGNVECKIYIIGKGKYKDLYIDNVECKDIYR